MSRTRDILPLRGALGTNSRSLSRYRRISAPRPSSPPEDSPAGASRDCELEDASELEEEADEDEDEAPGCCEDALRGVAQWARRMSLSLVGLSGFMVPRRGTRGGQQDNTPLLALPAASTFRLRPFRRRPPLSVRPRSIVPPPEVLEPIPAAGGEVVLAAGGAISAAGLS